VSAPNAWNEVVATPARLSVCMIALNEEARIGLALDSVAWADEIVVVDGGSSDRTAEIARAKGARVVAAAWPGNFADQLRRALAETREAWVFRLDCDEVVPPELASEIRAAIARPGAADGYRVKRRNFFLGKWMRHGGWWPDFQVRLVRRQHASVRGGPVHESIGVEGRMDDLEGTLLHDTHPTIEASLARLVLYSRLAAEERARRGRVTGFQLVVHPGAAFLRKFFVKSGWRDGWHGYLAAAIHGMVNFAVYARAWEMQRRGKS
jgi:glycosyltransferase involved in cell wall biosynthesis